jgi:hypothetical protein
VPERWGPPRREQWRRRPSSTGQYYLNLSNAGQHPSSWYLPVLRYPYEVRSDEEYFDEIQDVKITKDMLDLAKHIVNQKSGRFEPDKFEDQYETALVDLINKKRVGKPITAKERPRGENVVDLMDALRKSVGGAASETTVPKKPAKKSKATPGQKEMLNCFEFALYIMITSPTSSVRVFETIRDADVVTLRSVRSQLLAQCGRTAGQLGQLIGQHSGRLD